MRLQGLVKLLGGKNPTLYSYEKSLPYLPVPDLEATTERVSDINLINFEYQCRYIFNAPNKSQFVFLVHFFQYLESVRPVLSEERFKEIEKLALDFKV